MSDERQCVQQSSRTTDAPVSPTENKKTPILRNLYNCHSCGKRFSNGGRSEEFRLLDSHWRIVLLCEACFKAVRSADACSYCFEEFGENDSILCRHCFRRVHLPCLPLQRGYLLRSDLQPDFYCIDCSPFLGKPRVSAANRTNTEFSPVLEGETARQRKMLRKDRETNLSDDPPISLPRSEEKSRIARSGSPDRYLIKYFKRSRNIKERNQIQHQADLHLHHS